MQKIAMAWYRPEDWKKLLKISDDSEELEKSHNDWLISANNSFIQLRKKGLDVTKVFIDLDELISWCKEHRYKINGKSRSAFAAEKLEKLFQK
jgi:SMC interacting uncharacterized protein involved in chromosome segregation